MIFYYKYASESEQLYFGSMTNMSLIALFLWLTFILGELNCYQGI